MCFSDTLLFSRLKEKKKKKEEAAKNRVDSLLLTALTQSSDTASCILYSNVRQFREGPPVDLICKCCPRFRAVVSSYLGTSQFISAVGGLHKNRNGNKCECTARSRRRPLATRRQLH